jgi:hypothetical protein
MIMQTKYRDNKVTLGDWVLECLNDEPNGQGRFSLGKLYSGPVIHFTATLEDAEDILKRYYEHNEFVSARMTSQTWPSPAPAGHEKIAMEVDGNDYVKRGRRHHHALRFVCPDCGAKKLYVENLMGRRGNPMCDGITQKLQTPKN